MLCESKDASQIHPILVCPVAVTNLIYMHHTPSPALFFPILTAAFPLCRLRSGNPFPKIVHVERASLPAKQNVSYSMCRCAVVTGMYKSMHCWQQESVHSRKSMKFLFASLFALQAATIVLATPAGPPPSPLPSHPQDPPPCTILDLLCTSQY